ncbi:proline-rich proteoglycan 2-like [Tripterygium wilfordii]|uniref:proline-rich proteoglycan 2-like n=1 Tax=Tripterygium wilfordii TaxID=458696 RepID=UPI0018F803F3|nr:proline-rich proteoglycan 2-like [Tripterygium wilfordii]
MEPNRKPSFMFIVNSMMALAFFFSSIDARMYYDSMNFGTLPKYTPIPPSGPSKGGPGGPPLHFTDIDFGMLPKGPVPPSGPSKGGPGRPPLHFTDIDFGMLPKGPVPPSGPSKPPTIVTKRNLDFGMLPKYTPIPPSGPSKGGPGGPPLTG